MQRWHLTVGLAALALGAAVFIPRLQGWIAGPATAPNTNTTIPTVDIGTEVTPVQVVNVKPAMPTGHLQVSAKLDRTSVLLGRGQERYLVVQVEAPEDVGSTFRRPVDLGVVMDVSGSMSARGKIDYAKKSARLLASAMEKGDTYSLVTFSDDAKAIIPATAIDDPSSILRAIDRIEEGGGTNLWAGMDRGSREVKKALHGENVGRVVILSDGNANVGITDGDAFARMAGELAASGVSVSVIGLGVDYNEDLLARIADLGGGTYDFVDDPTELEAVFRDELDRTASVVARQTLAEITLPSGVEPVEIVGWDATATGSGWKVNLGDVYAGDSRKIVMKVRVNSDAVGTMAIADVGVSYHDQVDNVDALVSAATSAEVTQSQSVAENSIDKDAYGLANMAVGNWYLDLSSRAYASGDTEGAKRLAGHGTGVLRSAAKVSPRPEFQDQVDNLEKQQMRYETAPASSAEGQAIIKENKEDARAFSR